MTVRVLVFIKQYAQFFFCQPRFLSLVTHTARNAVKLRYPAFFSGGGNENLYPLPWVDIELVRPLAR